MTFKVSSLLVWLLATTTLMTMVFHRVAAQACDEYLACEADAVCGGECLAVGDTFNQVFEDCMNGEPHSVSICWNSMKTACCQTLASPTDCFANSLYVEAWWCDNLPSRCDWTYPTVEACEEIGVVGVTSGGVSSSGGGVEPPPVASPAPTAAGGTGLSSGMFLRHDTRLVDTPVFSCVVLFVSLCLAKAETFETVA